MGKYKQWLHHQEIGRRLRDQINTLEQERARVQKMAPIHPTKLPDLDNPLIAALLNYTRQGNKLSDIDPIQAAMPKMEPDLDQRRPATSAALKAAPAVAAAAPTGVTGSLGDEAVVSSLLARAESMPSDPLDQMRELARAREQDESTRADASEAAADSVGGWWQRHEAGED